MKRFLLALGAAALLAGCQTTPQQDADLVRLATRFAKQTEPKPPAERPYSIMPASFRSFEGGTGGGASTAPASPPVIISRDGYCTTYLINGQEIVHCIDPWKPVAKQIGLICNPNGVVRLDFTESLNQPIQWETWLYLTNWSAVLICDESGPKTGFYRVVHEN